MPAAFVWPGARKSYNFPWRRQASRRLLLVWHFTPDQRFVFPLYPLLAAGLWTELENVWRTLSASWQKPAFSDRCAAAIGGGVLTALAMFVAFTTTFGLFHFLPDLFDAYRSDLDSRRPAYNWMAHNVPREASVFAYDDPLLYLYTGRRSCSLPVPPKLYYHNDQAGIDELLDSIPNFARRYDLTYALITPGDFYRDLHARGASRLMEAVKSSHDFRPEYSAPGATVYEFTAAPNVAARFPPF